MFEPVRAFIGKASFKLMVVAFALALLAGGFLLPSGAQATNLSDSLIGAIRWDGQISNQVAGTLASVGTEEERALAANKWHFRLPFYGVETSANSVIMDGTSQTVMDQEIAYAKDAGIDYWAFCWYPDSTGLQTQRDLYLSSAYKNDVNWSVILFTNPMSSTDVDWLVDRFKESNYQKVLGGRPLVYGFNYPDLVSASLVAEIRSKSAAAGVPDPYIVALDFSASGAAGFANAIGADAISSYVTPGGGGTSFASLTANERNNWNAYKSTGKKVIPWVTAGWDPRPRIELTSPPYQYASYGAGDWASRATPSELASELQSAIDWNGANASAAEANAVLMYAWNEYSEGGYISPLKSGDGINRDLLDAVKSVTTSIGATSGNPGYASLITGQSLSGTLRNNYNDFVGMKITVGSSPLTVYELGRYYVPGNAGNHLLKIVKTSDNTVVANTIVNMGAGTADALGFKYAALSGPVTLAANTSYYIASSETSGGDQWYDCDTALSTSGVATIDSGYYRQFDSNSNDVNNTYGSAGNGYGPVNIKYTGGSAPANLALSGSYSSSSHWDANQTANKAFDGELSTNWQAGSGTTFSGQWLEVDFGANVTFNRTFISEYSDNRTTGYRIEYWNGSNWQTAHTGTTIGTGKTDNFTAVTGSKARLYFTSGSFTPIIFEFQIYNS